MLSRPSGWPNHFGSGDVAEFDITAEISGNGSAALVGFTAYGGTVTFADHRRRGAGRRTARGRSGGSRIVAATGADRLGGRRTLQPTRHPLPENVNPVRIAADAFAPGVPHCDVLLCPDHAVWHEGSLMPVRYLLNGATVV